MCVDKMHADEADIDGPLVRRLLAAQFPHWADLSIERVPSSGGRGLSLAVVRLPLARG